MKGRFVCTCALIICAFTSQQAAGQATTVGQLQDELAYVRSQVTEAQALDKKYDGGLIKSLIAMRLEVLQLTEALIQQRIHAMESGAPITTKVDAITPNPEIADQLLIEIQGQHKKVQEAQANSDKYAGGLVKAMAETALLTSQTTLATLEQKYFSAKYGLYIPPIGQGSITSAGDSPAPSVTPAPPKSPAQDCLEIENLDSSVIRSSDSYTKLAWKADIVNSCSRSFSVRVEFAIYDSEEFELDSDTERLSVPANGVGKARGTMLVRAEAANRMSRIGVSLNLR